MIEYFMCFCIAAGLDFVQIIREKQGIRMITIYSMLIMLALLITIYYFYNKGNVSFSRTILDLVGKIGEMR